MMRRRARGGLLVSAAFRAVSKCRVFDRGTRVGAAVVALGGDGGERRSAQKDENHSPSPLAPGLLARVAAELETAPEHRDYHRDRGDDVEGDHYRQDRVDG